MLGNKARPVTWGDDAFDSAMPVWVERSISWRPVATEMSSNPLRAWVDSAPSGRSGGAERSRPIRWVDKAPSGRPVGGQRSRPVRWVDKAPSGRPIGTERSNHLRAWVDRAPSGRPVGGQRSNRVRAWVDKAPSGRPVGGERSDRVRAWGEDSNPVRAWMSGPMMDMKSTATWNDAGLCFCGPVPTWTEPRQHASQPFPNVALVMKIMLSMMAPTVLGMPLQMQKGGWILAPALFGIACAVLAEMTWLVTVTITAMLDCDDVSEIATYLDYAGNGLGYPGYAVAGCLSVLKLFGTVCHSFIMTSQSMQYLIPLPSVGTLDGRQAWSVLLTALTVAYTFYDMVLGSLPHQLRRLDVFSQLAGFLFVVLSLVGIGMAAPDLEHFPESCKRALDLPYYSLAGAQGGTLLDAVLKGAAAASFALYCFAVVGNVPKLQSVVEDSKKLVRCSVIAYLACGVLFLSVMLSGYYVFGNLVPANTVKAMTVHRPPGWWALYKPWETGSGSLAGKLFAAAVAVHLVFTDGVCLPVTIQSLEVAVPHAVLHPRYGTPSRIALRLLVCLIRTVVGMVVSEFLAMASLTSCTCGIAINILVPILTFYAVPTRPRLPWWRVGAHVAIFFLASSCSVLGIWEAVASIVQRRATLPGAELREGVSGECLSECSRARGGAGAPLC